MSPLISSHEISYNTHCFGKFELSNANKKGKIVMANSRKKGKKKVSFWLTEAERNLLKEAADKEGLNMSDVIRTLLINNAKQCGIIR